jgi:hypothetical protein
VTYRFTPTLCPSLEADYGTGSYPCVTDDVDGQPRAGTGDGGAGEYSTGRVVRRPLTVDAGVDA